MEDSLLTVQIYYLDNIFNITNYVSILKQIPFIQAHRILLEPAIIKFI